MSTVALSFEDAAVRVVVRGCCYVKYTYGRLYPPPFTRPLELWLDARVGTVGWQQFAASADAIVLGPAAKDGCGTSASTSKRSRVCLTEKINRGGVGNKQVL